MHVMMIGPVSCGKTTLCQALAGLPRVSVKTQTVGIIGEAIDTPGEYLENPRYWNRLLVTAADADLVLLIQDCSNRQYRFAPGLASMFGCPSLGVVTKTDLAAPGDIAAAEESLRLAGAGRICRISALTGEGMEGFIRKLC
jgi:ethanolamine utilization protein EutP